MVSEKLIIAFAKLRYGKQIGNMAKNGTIALQKTVNGENVVTVFNPKNKEVVKTLKSKTDVLWNGIISKDTLIYNEKGTNTDYLSSAFQPNWGYLKKKHYINGDNEKSICTKINLCGNKMNFEQTHSEGSFPKEIVIKNIKKNDIDITNPDFRYGDCFSQRNHENKYANDVYKAAGSKYYNKWLS